MKTSNIRRDGSGAAVTRTLSASTTAILVMAGIAVCTFQVRISSQSPQFVASDPGVRGGAAGAGDALADLTPYERGYFDAGKVEFEESEAIDQGMGPRMNLDSCGGCHSQPALGGSSPAINPQIAFANKDGGTDTVPSFLQLNGPVREARFVKNPDGSADGGVHALFTLTGRAGATGCTLVQPDFESQVSKGNVIFRIPTPVFGAGLIEMIPDATLLANQASTAALRSTLGIAGRPNFNVSGRTLTGQMNRNGNDGTIARFGWKAQNKSLLIFSGEAYNVEMGVTNDLFQTEREEQPECAFASQPNSVANLTAPDPHDMLSAVEKFAMFMRLMAPPAPAVPTPDQGASIEAGKNLFSSVGCAACHTPSMKTGSSQIAALANKDVNLYSDLMLHDMGTGLADGVSQGEAGPREFRTAPLWGLGQRVYFLHDGRASDLITAINAHQSPASEGNTVTQRFKKLSETDKQNLLNFLRSL
jgi:CxxC motif-containing protein (DUF1111 family)